MIVKAYRNLNKECWSLMSPKTGKVILRPKQVFLENCEFKVSDKGRERVRKENRKNVHAFIIGDAKNLNLPTESDNWVEITYNPYEHDTFVYTHDGCSVQNADAVLLNTDGKAFVWEKN